MAEGRSDQEIEELDYQIGMTDSPEQEALRALQAHQETTGMQFEDPGAPVAVPDDGTPGWMTRDEEFS